MENNNNGKGLNMAQNKQLIKIFEYALTQEKNGLNFFQNALKQLEISATKNAFRRLIEEEEKHVEYIERILKGLREGPTLEESDFKIKALKKTQFFDKKTRNEDVIFWYRCYKSTLESFI